MNFINKLIKKGIFGLIFVFALFAYLTQTSDIAYAKECNVAINDGNSHLVLNAGSNWTDDGVTVSCGTSTYTDVKVSVNGSVVAETSQSGKYVIDSYVKSEGFYRVVYSYTDSDSVTHTVMRQIRVLPQNLNSTTNIWVADENVNTKGIDAFNKIINFDNGYLAIGDFNNEAYLVGYNLRGAFLWKSKIDSAISAIDIVNAGSNKFYVTGETVDGGYLIYVQPKTGASETVFGSMINLTNMTKVNKVATDGMNYYVAGYKLDNGTNQNYGVVAKIDESSNVEYFTNNLPSEYNSLIFNGTNIVVVGETTVAGKSGAKGGLVTVCSQNLNCASQNAYMYTNSDGATTTSTTFVDVLKEDTKYLVVGKTRIDKHQYSVNSNFGQEDGMVVLLDANYSVLDLELVGATGSDVLNSVKRISTGKYVAAGEFNGSGYYIEFKCDNENDKITIDNKNSLSGTMSINDVYVFELSNEENYFVFAGKMNSNKIADITFNNVLDDSKSNTIDSYLVIIDRTEIKNYEDLTVVQGTLICGDSTSCYANQIDSKYFIYYGTDSKPFPSDLMINTQEEPVPTYNTYHLFENDRGITYLIYRSIIITSSSVAGDIDFNNQGINKWYEYSRTVTQTNKSTAAARGDLWETIYKPVKNYENKQTGPDAPAYYVINKNGNFVIDETGRNYTYNNYVVLETIEDNNEAELNKPRAFKNIETLHEYALLQEYARIRMVNSNYNYDTSRIYAYLPDQAKLRNQNYYYVYYVDLDFDKGGAANDSVCKIENGSLAGTCTNYGGYAFANLDSISKMIDLILTKYNYFASESNSKYTGSVSVPTIEKYVEEVETIEYTKSKTISLPVSSNNTLSLVVTHYPLNAKGDGFETASAPVNVTGKTAVVFSENGDFTQEGKYEVKYCYYYGEVNQNCGNGDMFVIDRTAPVINYSLKSSVSSSFDKSSSATQVELIKATLTVSDITEIDPYAYIKINNKNYLLNCDFENSVCSKDLEDNLTQEEKFKYDPNDPDKIYELHVYDRAGNQIDVYFKIGYSKPTVFTNPTPGSTNEFSLTVNFEDANDFLSFALTYTELNACPAESGCTDGEVIAGAIENYIRIIMDGNRKILKANPEAEIQKSISLTFTKSLLNVNNGVIESFNYGVNIPVRTYSFNVTDEKTGEGYWEYSETDEWYVVNEGLYEFVISDDFYNYHDAFAGIGLGDTNMDIYIENDETYTETLYNIQNKVDIKIPGEASSAATFKAETPSTYKYVDSLPVTEATNSLDQEMFFANQFIYLKFEVSNYGVIQINGASKVNPYGNYEIDNTINLNCLITLHGTNVDENFENCGTHVYTVTTVNDLFTPSNENSQKIMARLNELGIYLIAYEGSEVYAVFTAEEIYSVTSEIKASSSGGSNIFTIPKTFSFNIDKQAPVIDFALVCKVTDTDCLEADNEIIDLNGVVDYTRGYQKTDFTHNEDLVNIGKYDMQLTISDYFVYGAGEKVLNQLLVMKQGEDIQNAYEYNGGRNIRFTGSGTYIITFEDAAGNKETFKFMIDQTPPTIASLTDADGKDFSQYNQFVTVNVSVNEASFFDNDTSILELYYTTNGVNPKAITVKGNDGKCSTNSLNEEDYTCSVTESGFTISFKVAVNDIERITGTGSIEVTAKDYFGNSSNASRNFEFDNQSPYIYYGNIYAINGSGVYEDTGEKYIPTTLNLNQDGSDENRNKILQMKGATIDAISCENIVKTFGIDIVCNDTPESGQIKNNVKIKMYEAYEAAYNNYYIEGTEYVYIANGTYLDPEIYGSVYKLNGNYSSIESTQELEGYITGGTRKVYSHYIKMNSAQQINPNDTYYYYNNGWKEVNISNMYENDANVNTWTGAKKELYDMYMGKGTFEDATTKFYYCDDEEFAPVEYDDINVEAFSDYYVLIAVSGYSESSGVYLPAETEVGSCIVVDGVCIDVGAGKIKLEGYDYYNTVYAMEKDKLTATASPLIIPVQYKKNGTTVSNYAAILDTNIWQTSVEFRFGLANNIGRPIIITAIDGAGNIGSTQLETMIIINDNQSPTVTGVNRVNYILDETGSTVTGNNSYLREEVYYRIENIAKLSCNSNTSYYTVSGNVFNSVPCLKTTENQTFDSEGNVIPDGWNENTHYYALDYKYVKVDEGQTKVDGKTYYIGEISPITNYITDKNFSVDFSEPLSKIECTYFLHTKDGDVQKDCNIHATQFTYTENKTNIDLIFEDPSDLDNYYVNFEITVYDFSNNFSKFSYFFIDRESPEIKLNDNVNKLDLLEAKYPDENDTVFGKYTSAYKDSNYLEEISMVDNINDRIIATGSSAQITNTLISYVKYYKYNHRYTYNNYEYASGAFILLPNGEPKVAGKEYYVAIEENDDYIFKGNKECKDGYCYILDDGNYYPELLKLPNQISLSDNKYWTEVEEISELAVGVYAIEYTVYDVSGNTSLREYKTVYIQDKSKPTIAINDNIVSELYGYHSSSKITVVNEYESTLYVYTCQQGLSNCDLPSELFATVDPSKVAATEPINITKAYTTHRNSVGAYKLFLVDKGSFVETVDKTGKTLQTLKYNYTEYTYIIDKTAPNFTIDAYEDAKTNKLYYVVSLSQEEYLYCAMGDDELDPSNYTTCMDSLFIKSTRTEISNDGTTQTLYNIDGDVVAEIKYKQKLPTEQKYFYNTYYKYEGNSFISYPMGTAFAPSETNVYLINSIKIYFREEGTYKIRGVDKAGNMAGKDRLGYDSTFTIDNTAPVYNEDKFDPTGVNYWYSVPKQIITRDNMQHMINIGNKKEGGFYSIYDSGLNTDFFYAFPTRIAAYNYLLNTYRDYINYALPDNTCTTIGGDQGTDFDYYNPATQNMVSGCLTKADALTAVMGVLNDMIFETFSEDIFFGDDKINQTVCDSGDLRCQDSKDMYVYVYLKYVTSGASTTVTITDTCEADANTKCQLINLKVVLHDSINDSNPIILDIGTENTVDTSKIEIYSGVLGTTRQTPNSKPTKTHTIKSVTEGYYYIFVEYDNVIDYTSSNQTEISHTNITYYGIYAAKAGEYLSVYYEENGVENNSSIVNNENGKATKLTNADEYYLILRDKKDGGNNTDEDYEIYYTVDENGHIDEIYSYLRVIINEGGQDRYININEKGKYIITTGASYYIRIPLSQETYTTVKLIDRAGTTTTIYVSRSQIAPSIEVSYQGEGSEHSAIVTITDTSLVKTKTNYVQVLFSPDGQQPYTNSQTKNILDALLCNVINIGQDNPYGCTKKNAVNGINAYEVKITNAEDLIGFFKVQLTDDHGNTNTINFMYNPVDLSTTITTSGTELKYIDSVLTEGIVRIATKDTLQIQFDNEWNYIILYKVDSEGNKNPVCNTKGEGISNNFSCGGEGNYVSHTVVENKYESSTLHYETEGLYQIEVVNRKTETVNSICVNNGVVSEDCKAIITSTSKNCSWSNNPDICAGALEVRKQMVEIVNGNEKFSHFEIDKTAPVYNTNNFAVKLPSGEDVKFSDGAYYVNGEITIPWYEEAIRLTYKCEYQNKLESGQIVYETCGSNNTTYNETNKEFTFKVHDVNLSNTNTYRYTFQFEDYVGNKTTPLSFYIVVELPKIAVVKLNSDGSYGDEVSFKETINSNTKLLCYVDGVVDYNCQTYSVKLYRYNNINGYEQVSLVDNTIIRETGVNTYKYVVSIKSLTSDYVYSNLSVETEFTIDRAAPGIKITGNAHPTLGIYTGEVKVVVDSDSYVSIFTGCTVVGEDENKNKVYEGCTQEVIKDENVANYTIKTTGIYKVVAVDFYGNASEEVYFTIDNTNPDIKITAQGAYLDYEIPEKAYSNATTVIIESLDNNEDSTIRYRTKSESKVYSDWITHNSSSLTIVDEGYYEVQAIDLVGNEGLVRSFIIYRQAPKFAVYVGNKLTTEYSVITQPTYITWDSPNSELVAPIIKVIMNGKKYEKRTVIEETGEYEFVFTDLAGNITTHKLTINTSSQICLDNKLITPNKQYLFSVDNIKFSGGQGYTFKADDVMLFVTPTNYYGVGTACGANVLSYKTLADDAYIWLTEQTAKYINNHTDVEAAISPELTQKIEELGGFVYVVIVDLDVAKKELGFDIGESFFTKDPIGWSLIFVTGAALLYIGIRLVFFRKKIKVLK